MLKPSYQLSTYLYRNYHIAEWPEKCCILTEDEQRKIISSLETNSPLVELVKLPFPAFAEKYFASFDDRNNFFKDPEFPYKLYFLSPANRRYFTERLRTPSKKRADILAEFGLPNQTFLTSEFQTILETRLEDIPKISSSQKNKRNYEIKYAYLTQYIDINEAKRMNMHVAETFHLMGVTGYGLEAKMRLLNPVTQTMMAFYLGLYGLPRLSKKEISLRLNLIQSFNEKGKRYQAFKVFNYFFPFFLKTYGEFEHFLGYKKERQTPGNFIEYASKPIRDLDVLIETTFIFSLLPQIEREILAKYTKEEVVIYLAAKYMFKTPETLARNVVLSTQDAEKALVMVQNGVSNPANKQ